MYGFEASQFDCRRQSRQPRRNVITRLHASPLASVEDLACPSPSRRPRCAGYTDCIHIVLPLSGSFQYREGSRTLYAGANHLMIVPPRREYQVDHPIEGDRSLVLFPRSGMTELFEQFARADDTQVRAVSPKLRLAALSLLSAARAGDDPLGLDELSVELCQLILEGGSIDVPDALNGRGATLARAREYLHARYRDPISLADVACEVGVTPVYLTQLFKRSSGMALHQYLVALRLNEALLALPEADDLTALALDLGFSSHSHFTAVFRSRFGVTPSCFRRRYAGEGGGGVRVQLILPQRPLCLERGGDPADQLV